MKNLKKIGRVLDKSEQKEIHGGFGPVSDKVICHAPYLIPDHNIPCAPGYHLHPGGLCLCCKDSL